MSWYMTVFSLSATIFQLLGVRVSECLGRQRTLLALTSSTFVITLVCGFSVNSEMFIACRLIQVCFILGLIFFVPVNIGFYYLIDIPLKPEQSLSKENLKTLMRRIDPIGCILIASGMTLFLLGMHLGSASDSYTWSSPLVIGFLAGFGLLLLIFLVFEKFISPCPLFSSSVVLDIHLALCYIQQFVYLAIGDIQL
ncbi:hypothetical protein K501DRAFT_274853 [Backusella circina FSU 941]|nr:hypothetical protein K501DRAFT_274853 [Backusella circina FSU 941]